MNEELPGALAGARVIDLEQPRYAGAPVFEAHEPGLNLFLHRRHEAPSQGGRTSASAMLVTSEHCGTHIDALCHQAEDGLLCDGTPVTPELQTPAGISHLDCESIPPLIRRGVLVDVAAVDPDPPAGLIGAELLIAAVERQGIEIRPGDAVLVRTGSGARYDDPARYEAGPGVSGDASRWLAARQPGLVGADNLAWDLPGHLDPELGCTLPGHVHLICRAGIYIIENLMLEELSESGVGEFLLACLPLKIRGATGSPVRPVAIITQPT